MMNLLVPLLTFLAGNAQSFLKSSGQQISVQVTEQIRSIVSLVIILVFALVLSCVSLSMFIVRLAAHLEDPQDNIASPSMIVFLVATIVSMSVLIYFSTKKSWNKKTTLPPTAKATKPSGAMENALALLVMDFIEERQAKREARAQNTSAEDAANREAP